MNYEVIVDLPDHYRSSVIDTFERYECHVRLGQSSSAHRLVFAMQLYRYVN